MQTHRDHRTDKRLDADTAICALGAILLWGFVLLLCLMVQTA